MSASGTLSCASCHAPAQRYAPDNARAVQLGGADGRQPGTRAVPSLRYLTTVPPFNEHYEDSDGDGTDQGPAGGLTWDGRAPSAHDQARLPLLSPVEMANGSEAALVERVRQSSLAPALRETFGDDVLASTASGFKAITLALEIFQQTPEEFYPFDSKYDAYLRGRAQLTASELRGLRVFEDPAKGNCAHCHTSRVKSGGFPLFTDFGFVALGVPRNAEIAANADAQYFDLGLCGPLRKDLASHKEYCGMFRTPSLRNVATRRRFFHNGVFSRLRDAVAFYALRDTGRIAALDDLPAEYRANINREPPFGRRAPTMTDHDIDDVVTFLGTLSDGYRNE